MNQQNARAASFFGGVALLIAFMAWPNIQTVFGLGPKMQVTVVDCLTYAPIPGADVFVPDAYTSPGVTDLNGFVEIDASRIKSRETLVVVGKDGYMGASGFAAPGSSVTAEMCRGEAPNPWGFGEN